MNEDKITLTYNEFGGVVLDLSTSGLSYNDKNAICDWAGWHGKQGWDKAHERILQIIQEGKWAGLSLAEDIENLTKAINEA